MRSAGAFGSDSDVRHSTTRIAGHTVRYREVEGADPPFLLIHGGGIDCCELSWPSCLPLLSRQRRVLALDLPGFGDSQPLTTECSHAFLVQVVEQFIDEIAGGPVVLVGLSFGGLTALGVVANSGHRAVCLSLIASMGLGRRLRWDTLAWLGGRVPLIYQCAGSVAGLSAWTARVSMSAVLAGEPGPRLLSRVRRHLSRRPRSRGWLSFLRQDATPKGFRTSYRHRLGDLKLPVQLIHGTRDRMIPVRHSVEAAERLPDSELVLLQEGGHWVPVEQPDRLSRALLDFAERKAGLVSSPSLR